MPAYCYLDTHGEPRALIVHPSTRHPGSWQLSTWDDFGPIGHTEAPTLEEAQADATRRGYRLTDSEPPWLGLCVVSGGRLDPLGAQPPQT